MTASNDEITAIKSDPMASDSMVTGYPAEQDRLQSYGELPRGPQYGGASSDNADAADYRRGYADGFKAAQSGNMGSAGRGGHLGGMMGGRMGGGRMGRRRGGPISGAITGLQRGMGGGRSNQGTQSFGEVNEIDASLAYKHGFHDGFMAGQEASNNNYQGNQRVGPVHMLAHGIGSGISGIGRLGKGKKQSSADDLHESAPLQNDRKY